MKILNKIKDCLRLIKRIWKSDSEIRSHLYTLIDKLETVEDKQLCIDSILWLHDAKKAVVLSVDKNNEYSYNSNDAEYDINFRNQCKFLINEGIFNKIGQENYQNNLQTLEPDLYTSFVELDYQQARADYNERLVEYIKAANDPLGMKSNQLSRLWNDVCELENIYKTAEINLNNL